MPWHKVLPKYRDHFLPWQRQRPVYCHDMNCWLLKDKDQFIVMTHTAIQRRGPVYCHDQNCYTKTGISLMPWHTLLKKKNTSLLPWHALLHKDGDQFIVMTNTATQRWGPVYCHDKYCYTKTGTSSLPWQTLLHKDLKED